MKELADYVLKNAPAGSDRPVFGFSGMNLGFRGAGVLVCGDSGFGRFLSFGCSNLLSLD